jgi:pimeloyl-ACP methyl ester carboxylesterase
MNYLVELIIRPARNLYNVKDLGDQAFTFSGHEFKRIDFNTQIKNSRGHKISCSFWCPLEMSSKELAYSPCIIYCHGNAGNKIDIIEIFEFLSWEFNICSFDFSGAGYSDGEFVTLGYFEKDDIKAVVDFLRNELNIQKVILYGRSMGAVSSLRYAEMDPNLKAIVLDSPFADFPKLCQEILSNKFFIPNVVSSFLISMARNQILEKVDNFDISEFLPFENAKNVQVPTILIHGQQDSLVGIDHSRKIFENLNKNTYKKLLEVEGEHNDCRSASDVNTIRDFIMQFAYDSLIIKEHKRRLNIKNAHLNYTSKNGININMVISNFKNSIKSQNMLNSSNSKQEKRKMNNFNIHGQIKKHKLQATEDLASKDKVRSRSTDTIDSDILSSKHKKENMPKKQKKRDNSNSNNICKFKKKENFNSNNIKMIKYHEYTLQTDESNNDKQMKEKIEESDQDKNNDRSIINPNKDKGILLCEPNENVYYDCNSLKSMNSLHNSCINPSSNPLNESQIQIDNLTTNRNNLTFNSFPVNLTNKNRLRNERNNILGGILECEVRVKSDQITFTNVDKSSIRKRNFNDDNSKLNESTLITTNFNSNLNTHN